MNGEIFLFKFWIRRTYSSPLEQVSIEADDSFSAINLLPECVYWDFCSK